MFPNRQGFAASLLLFAVFACASDSISPDSAESDNTTVGSPKTPNPPTTPDKKVAAIILFRKDWSQRSFNPPIPVTSVVQIAGMRQTIWAKVLTKSGEILENASVMWTSSNPQAVPVATNGSCWPQAQACNRTSIYALDTGRATVTATVDGVSASLSVSAYVDAPETDEVTLVFSVVELAPAPDWGYAPQLGVASRVDLDVVAIRYTIPGVGTTSLCGSSRHVAVGQNLELFPEIYGDYALVHLNRNRATGPASVTVFVQDKSGTVFKAVASGAIVPGGMPTTYTGGVIDEPWQLPC